MPANTGDPKQAPYEWAFIFIIYANHDAEDEVVANPAPGSDDMINATARWVGHLYNDLNGLKIDQKHKILILHNKILKEADETHLQELSPPDGKIVNIGNMNEPFLLQKPALLGQRLKQLLQGVEAEKHCVIFCDHGSIFGINKVKLENGEIRRQVYKNPSVRDYSFYGDKNKIDLFVRELEEKSQGHPIPFEVLTNEELATALAIGIGKKVDLLMMYNCNMVNLMTLFSLQGSVEVLLGAASTMNYPGYNFSYVLSKLFRDDIRVSAAELAHLFLISFNANNPKYVSQEEEIDSWTIAAFYPDDLTQQFLYRFNVLCELMMKHIQSFHNEIRLVLFDLYPLDGNAKENNRILFDFRSMVVNLHERLVKNRKYENLLELKDQLLLFSNDRNLPRYSLFLGADAFKIGRITYDRALQHPTGLGIFVPREDKDIEEHIDSFFRRAGNPLPAFFVNTRWLEFCKAYCDVM